MFQAPGSRQRVAQCLPDLRIAWVALCQASKVGQDLIHRPATLNQKAIAMQRLRQISAR